jgi:2-amino-4-hydroxy-6-hydroxymethyldihydropteridine diphosphokinase
LSEHFAGITFADIDDTAPVHMHNSAHFLNQVAHINTSLTKEAVNKIFKDIERAAGRCPEDRRKEIVRLDIDLLTYSDEVLKPDDVSREYIVKGIESIS